MIADDFLKDILSPGIAWCESLPSWNIPFDARAKVLLIAIAGQESRWSARVQSGNGPAHSLFQMERGGMIAEVLANAKTAELANEVCRMMYIAPDAVHAWSVMATERGDKLAVAFARLGLWLDPRDLPALDDEQAAFETYVRIWRPGAITDGGSRAVETRDRWHAVYQWAISAVVSAPIGDDQT